MENHCHSVPSGHTGVPRCRLTFHVPAPRVQWCMETLTDPAHRAAHPGAQVGAPRRTGRRTLAQRSARKSAHPGANSGTHIRKVGSGRTECRQVLVMSLQPDQLTQEAFRKARTGVGRSPFFEWLLGVHDDLVVHGSPLAWKSICALAAELGKHDGSGKPPTPRRATKTWTAVRRAKANDAAMHRSGPPSLSRDDTQPDQTPPHSQLAFDPQGHQAKVKGGADLPP
jgi:hypothetical protein